MNLRKKPISYGKIKLIISTLGFTPKLLVSEHIFNFLSEKGKLKPLNFIIIYPNQNPQPEQLVNAKNIIEDKLKILQKENLKIDFIFYLIKINNFQEAVMQLMDIIGAYYNKEMFQISKFELYFNLSGGMNFLTLSCQIAALYCPTNEIFTTIENTDNIRQLEVNNLIPIINETRYEILKTFSKDPGSKNFDEISEVLINKKKDRSTIYRVVNKMVEENLLTKKIFSEKNNKYIPTLHGFCTLKALELFPDFYYFPLKK